ncbi:MAG: hypothetical protein ACRDH9_03095 [Actinomycetota bacterium]
MKARILVPLLLAAFIIPTAATPSWACSCAPLSKEELADSARVVFTGRVLEIDKNLYEHFVRFRVTKIYKGSVDRRAEVVTASNSAACGCFFKEGQRYTVFASNKREPLRTNLCSGTGKGAIDHEEWGLPPGHSPTES